MRFAFLSDGVEHKVFVFALENGGQNQSEIGVSPSAQDDLHTGFESRVVERDGFPGRVGETKTRISSSGSNQQIVCRRGNHLPDSGASLNFHGEVRFVDRDRVLFSGNDPFSILVRDRDWHSSPLLTRKFLRLSWR